MSYRKAHKDPPAHRIYPLVLRAPPPTPPELDPGARELEDNTIDELYEPPRLRRRIVEWCSLKVGLPPAPMPSPKWDFVPMLPGHARRTVFMYCWGPPDVVACQIRLTSTSGRQGWFFDFAHRHANWSHLGRLPDGTRNLRRNPKLEPWGRKHVGESGGDLINDSGSTGESFVGTDDGFEDGCEKPLPVPEACHVNSMQRSHKAKRRIVNAAIPRTVL
jgi:hypothetical protein